MDQRIESSTCSMTVGQTTSQHTVEPSHIWCPRAMFVRLGFHLSFERVSDVDAQSFESIPLSSNQSCKSVDWQDWAIPMPSDVVRGHIEDNKRTATKRRVKKMYYYTNIQVVPSFKNIRLVPTVYSFSLSLSLSLSLSQ
jgi:hypothetical protein